MVCRGVAVIGGLHARSASVRGAAAADQQRYRTGAGGASGVDSARSGPMKAGGHDDAASAYFLEAASWDADRNAQREHSVRIAWRVASAAWICALANGGALLFLMPLKQVEPYLIRVDSSTGVVDSVPVYDGTGTLDESITRYFLSHYVSVCERFNLSTAESDYEECGAFHTAQRNQVWYALWKPQNPNSPLNVHRDGSEVRVQIESVSFFKRATGVQDLAQVRYSKFERASPDAQARATHWIATVHYGYSSPSNDPAVRRWNPLGFRIVEFASEPEVPGESAAGVAPEPRGVGP
jgi:type IV secretion system protein VirB8